MIPIVVAAALLVSPMSRPAASTVAASVQRAGPGDPAGFCATRAGALSELFADHFSRVMGEPLPSPHSTDVGEIAVLEDDGTFFYLTKDNFPKVDLMAVSRAFYRTHGDDYDFMAVFLSSGLSDYLGSPTAFASAFVVRQPTQGIGLGTFDYGAAFGSPARLEMITSMNGLHRYPADPEENIEGSQNDSFDALGHELGHRWLAYVFVDSAGTPSPALLGRGRAHWGLFFDAGASIMEGCDWIRIDSDSFRTVGVSLDYGLLDQYLMGLRAKSELDSFFVVNEPTAFDPPGTYVPSSEPLVGLGCRGRATYWSIDDIEAVHGPRVPDAASAPHAFRMAVVLVTARGNAAIPSDLAKLDTLRARFGPYFDTATGGRGSIDLSLDSRAGRVCIFHAPLADTEDALSPRPIGARVVIAQAGIPIALDPTSVQAHWRPAGAGSYTPVPMAPAGPDSFAASLPPFPSGMVEYYLAASSDSAGIEAFDPPAGPAGPHSYRVGTDVTPPVMVHVRVPVQGAPRLPQALLARVTDNLGVDSVWVEFAIDAGAAQSATVTPAGRDSYLVAIGAGLLPGQRLRYRFASLDGAATQNLAYSNPAFDTLEVAGSLWLDDFENGPHGYTHAPFWYSYRDAWHLTQEQSSPPGGTAWKCGATSPVAYPPHLDANLYLPEISSIAPVTELRFDHRFDLEQANGTYAWDGVRVEARVGSGPWQVMAPQAGYSHVFLLNSNPFEAGTPCWSGNSGGWRVDVVDLSPLAPGPVSVRFRLLAEEFIGGEGWFVDKVRLIVSGTTGAPVAARADAVGRPWPNPAGRFLRQSVALTSSAMGTWSLYDLMGRRVATLWSGSVPGGGFELAATFPAGLASGIYLARLEIAGRSARTDRIAVLTH